MLSLSPATRIFLAVTPVDGRKSFNGLYSLVKETLQQEPTSGYLFVFTNRRKNRLKILFWDGSGLCLFCKRLERGSYAWPDCQDISRGLRPEELQLLVHGIDGQPRQRWYRSA
ncbi:MAG TPA: IS66 family insertion sequence element accessory protein TnpB [Verrucomicrobiae bacterium]|nr:IS66 family insertion sequence element accessory protein TnpB [Verrucomicrobiae bacterium]